MVRLYEKPDFYDDVVGKEVRLDKQKDEIAVACAYMTQDYINKHFRSGFITVNMMEDLLNDTLVNVLASIPVYQAKEPDTQLPFWPYIYKQIEKWSKASYHACFSTFGETADTHRRAKKVWRMLNEEHLPMEEVMRLTGYKKSTIEKYVMLTTCVLSLDKEDEAGTSLHDFVGARQNSEEAGDEKLARLQPILDALGEEERFIITTYLQMAGKKDYRRQTEIICKSRGISGHKVTNTIRKFKEKCKDK